MEEEQFIITMEKNMKEIEKKITEMEKVFFFI